MALLFPSRRRPKLPPYPPSQPIDGTRVMNEDRSPSPDAMVRNPNDRQSQAEGLADRIGSDTSYVQMQYGPDDWPKCVEGKSIPEPQPRRADFKQNPLPRGAGDDTPGGGW